MKVPICIEAVEKRGNCEIKKDNVCNIILFLLAMNLSLVI